MPEGKPSEWTRLKQSVLGITVTSTLVLAGCTSDDVPTPDPPVGITSAPANETGPSTPDNRPLIPIQVSYLKGAVDPNNGSHSIRLGSVVDLSIVSDVDDVALIEGLNLTAQVAGGSGRFQFTATTPGRFRVQLRDRSVTLTILEIGQ